MKDFFIGLLVVVIILSLTLLFAWAITGNEFFLYKTFAPKFEQARRETFEQSKAYNQGMIQELQNMQFEYIKTTNQNSKDALASIILHRVADFDENKLPYDLRSFIQDLKNKQNGGPK